MDMLFVSVSPHWLIYGCKEKNIKESLQSQPCTICNSSGPLVFKTQIFSFNYWSYTLCVKLNFKYLLFSAVFIELVYIMASIWRHYFYYLFGFLFVVLILLIVLCSEVSILMTYIYLCK